jgi:hypothetical protein
MEAQALSVDPLIIAVNTFVAPIWGFPSLVL